MPDFPWAAWAQAQQAKNMNKMSWADAMQALGQLGGQAAIQIPQQRRQAQAQNQFGQTLQQQTAPVQGPANAPVQGPETMMGQPPAGGTGAPVQPPPNLGVLGAGFGKAYPGQSNPFLNAIARGQQQPKPLSPNLNAELMMQQAKLAETTRNNKANNDLRSQTVKLQRENTAMKQFLASLKPQTFNAGQTQKADTWNAANLIKSLFGGGVKPQTVPFSNKPTTGGGLTPEESKRLKELEAKYGNGQ
jgi:hypothetical protein